MTLFSYNVLSPGFENIFLSFSVGDKKIFSESSKEHCDIIPTKGADFPQKLQPPKENQAGT
jgi:hypothetical protein